MAISDEYEIILNNHTLQIRDLQSELLKRRNTRIAQAVSTPEILLDRLNDDFTRESIIHDPKEYKYKTWNHLAKSGMSNLEQEIVLKLSEEGIPYFNDEENHYRKLFDNLPPHHIKLGTSLAYDYNPEHCFNSMIDVIDMKRRLRPLDAKSKIEIETIKQVYNPRILESKKDSLYKPTEFPPESMTHQKAFTQLKKIQRSPYLQLKEDVKHYTNYMKMKKCFLLREGHHSETMLECLEPSEEYKRLTDDNYLFEPKENSKEAEQNPNQTGTAQNTPLAANASGLRAEIRSIDGSNRSKKKSSIRKQAIELERIQKENILLGTHKSIYDDDSYLGVSNSFVDSFVEVDAQFYISKEKELAKGYLEPEDFYSGLIEREKEYKSLGVLNWSGEQIYSLRGYSRSKTMKVISALNTQNLDVWMEGLKGAIKAGRTKASIFIFHPIVSSIIFFFVVFYVIILLLSNLLSESAENGLRQLSNFFTFVFVIELGLKIFALGPHKFGRSIANVIDFAAVTVNLIDVMILIVHPEFADERNGSFDGTMILRMFIVFRIIRYLKTLKFMKVILEVTKAAAGQYLLVAAILVILMFVYILFGVQTYHGKLNYPNRLPRYNFDGLLGGFISLLQIITMKNWLDILQVYLNADVDQRLTLVFILSWIIIGNYIIFNLFLATLLGGFESPEVHKTLEENKDEFQELQEILKKSYLEKLETKERLDQAKEAETHAITYIMNPHFDHLKIQNLEDQLLEQNPLMKKKRGTYVLTREMHSNSESSDDYLLYRLLDRKVEPEMKREAGKYDMYKRIHCRASLYIFKKENIIRFICTKIVTSPW